MSENYYRKPQYMSPSSYKKWGENRQQYYQDYLSPRILPRDPQNHHMSVGSAFDAYAKAYLHTAFVNDNDPKYSFEELFNAQVEPHNREQARIDGGRCFDIYKHSGALQDWTLKLSNCVGKPRFETTLTGVVDGYRPGISKRVGGVPLSGKPDLYFVTQDRERIISDWKLNGYYSKSGVSPKPGYVRLYPGFEVHKDCVTVKRGQISVNSARTMDKVDAEWAAQLSIYAWILGEEVGGDFLTMIHQIVCRPMNIRVAEHCTTVDRDFQHTLFGGLQDAWYRIQEGLIFDDMSVEQSLAYAKILDEQPPLTPEQISLMGPQPYWRR